jgi:hypothetical protein
VLRGNVVAPKLPATPSARKTWLSFASVLVFYPAVVLLSLRQWASPDPWSRLDLFSGGYLVLTLTLFAQQSVFADRIAGHDSGPGRNPRVPRLCAGVCCRR